MIEVTQTIRSIAEEVFNNEDLLPAFFPKTHLDHEYKEHAKKRFMQEIFLTDYKIALFQGHLTREQLHDLQCLNHWLISKYGKMLRAKALPAEQKYTTKYEEVDYTEALTRAAEMQELSRKYLNEDF